MHAPNANTVCPAQILWSFSIWLESVAIMPQLYMGMCSCLSVKFSYGRERYFSTTAGVFTNELNA